MAVEARVLERPLGSAVEEALSEGLHQARPYAQTSAAFAERTMILSCDATATAVAAAVVGFSPISIAFAALVPALITLRSGGSRISLRALDEAPWLVTQVAIASLLGGAVAAAAGADVLLQAALTVPAIVMARAGSYAAIRSGRNSRVRSRPVLIVGMGNVGRDLNDVLEQHPEYGMHAVGFLDHAAAATDIPHLGPPADLERVLSEHRVERVIVAFGPTASEDMVPLLRVAVQFGVEVYVVPRFFELGVSPSRDVEDLWGIPLQRLHTAAHNRRSWQLKRLFDVAVAGTALVVLAPLMAVIAASVRMSGHGPILFRQRRVGRRGRHFDVLKFRTMRVNSDSDTQWSVAHDSRCTFVGRLLRRSSLDELPQLWNILRGDMSLVGPRPERPFFVVQFADEVRGYDDRHRVPAGLTGWAQVHGLRGDTSIRDRARFDNFYIEHWSLWRDLTIMVRTAGALFRGR